MKATILSEPAGYQPPAPFGWLQVEYLHHSPLTDIDLVSYIYTMYTSEITKVS